MNIPRAKLALLVARIYSVAIIVAGFFLPAYTSLSVTSTGEVKRVSTTLVGENGFGSVFVLSVPLVLTLAVGVALRLHAKRRAMAVAWTLTGLFAMFNAYSMPVVGTHQNPNGRTRRLFRDNHNQRFNGTLLSHSSIATEDHFPRCRHRESNGCTPHRTCLSGGECPRSRPK
jgi:hypothetical protein